MKRAALTALVATMASMLGTSVHADNGFDYCLLCHGDNGNGNKAINAPKISGMEPWYLARQLENFADGIRGTPGDDAAGHEMGPVGMRLKHEGNFDAAVKFVGSLKSERPAPTIAGDIKRGKQLYATCATCHGAAGEGNQSVGAPALAWRTDWYLVTQLHNFKEGVRGADPRDAYGALMRPIAATLPDDKAITDVVAYINTLKRK